MHMFKDFNPLSQASQNSQQQDPRQGATPVYAPPQPEPMRGVDIPNNQQAQESPQSQKSAVDILDAAWNTDPSKLPKDAELQTVSDADFTKASESFKPTFTPEQLAAAQESPEAMQALLDGAARQGLAASAAMSSKVTENYLAQERAASDARLQRTLTRSSVLAEVKKLNPALTTGPFKGLTEDLVGKYMSTNPDVSPADAAALVDKYVSEKLGLQKPTSAEKSNTDEGQKDETTNWVDFSKAVE